MDRSAPPRHRDRRPAANLTDGGRRGLLNDDRLRVGLQRTVELKAPGLSLRDWPGQAGPLIHIPDPFGADHGAADALAAACSPMLRVMSLRPRGGAPYQVDAQDVLAYMDQFGFATPIVVGEGLGCLTAVLVAAWQPHRARRLILLNAPSSLAAPSEADTTPAVLALRDCRPDWLALQARVRCPILHLRSAQHADAAGSPVLDTARLHEFITSA